MLEGWANLVIQAKFGFVAFSDPEDFLKAWKEMDGKYIVTSLDVI